MFEYTRTTISHKGTVLESYHSEPENGEAEEFLDLIYAAAEKAGNITVQSGNAVMIVSRQSSSLVQAEDLTPN